MTIRQAYRVLLVDDSEDHLMVMREVMDDEPLLEVSAVATDGEQAWTYLQGLAASDDLPLPDIVMLDINMPKMNGLEVLEAIRNCSCLSHLPVVILTTSDREEDLLQSYRKGANSFVTKPAGFSQVRELVHKFAIYWTEVASLPSCKG